jgi:pimeloyl-ACP methyl ester carboxylesterase
MSEHLALVLQGGGAGPYTAPLLIPSLALEEIGAKVEVVPYPDFRPSSLELEAARDFDEQVTAALRAIVASATWSRITFVAKSRGTLYLAAMSEPLPCDRVDAIWVTPLLGLDYVRDGLLSKSWPSLIVAGSADPYHDAAAHAEVSGLLAARQVVIADADHGLVVAGDVRRTVDGFRELAEASLAFASSPP